ncbi:hypothetical protein SCHPADRAFT_588002 [Schizopora paradoxa]|uniref:DUF6533 domain-containing protein n=1 Tax=Schizopora paradoxa TaxID=27342 RepID=A0A0H2RVU7_9AGAM|nr:hypothetical protein SCHPADRAFT_588002 [Schizopora paradoxa]
MTSLAQTITLLEQSVVVKYFYFSNAFLLFYDTVLCFGDDVQYIWKARWSAGKVLYIVARYFAFVDLTLLLIYSLDPSLSPSRCRIMYETSAWFQVVGVLVAEILLIIRTYALYQRNSYVLAYLICLELGLTIPSIIFINQSFGLMDCEFLNNFEVNAYFSSSLFYLDIQSPAPTILPCLPITEDTMTWFAFMCICIFDFNVSVLTVYKGFHQWSIGMSRAPLVRTIYRDGGLYFICLFVVSLANVLLLKEKQDSAYYLLLIGLQRVLHAVLTSRLIINVRRASKESWSDGTAYSIEYIKDKDVHKSSLQFANQIELHPSTWTSQHASTGDVSP